MSYALEITDPAMDDLRRLAVWLQEETHEMDSLAMNPPERRRGGDIVYDFVRVRENETFYIFLTIRLDSTTQTLRVQSVGQFIRRDG